MKGYVSLKMVFKQPNLSDTRASIRMKGISIIRQSLINFSKKKAKVECGHK